MSSTTDTSWIVPGADVVVDTDRSFTARGAVGVVAYVDRASAFRPVKVKFASRFEWLNVDEIRPAHHTS